MKYQNLNDVIERLAKTKPALLKRFAEARNRLLEGGCFADEDSLTSMTSTVPPVKKGDLPDTRVNFQVHFIKSTDANTQPFPQSPSGMHKRGLAVLLNGVSTDEQEQLRNLEPALLQWIATKKENAAHFFADPIGSLEKAGIQLDPTLLRKINNVRSRSLQAAPSLPYARIESIKVDVQSSQPEKAEGG